MESFLLVYQMAQSNHRALGVPPRASHRLRVTFPYVPQDENVVDELYPYGRHGHGHGHGHGAASGSGVTVTWGSKAIQRDERTHSARVRALDELTGAPDHAVVTRARSRIPVNPDLYIPYILSIGPRVELA